MLETIINGGVLISVFAIAAPFLFVLCVIKIVTGANASKKKPDDADDNSAETIDMIYKGLRDLNRRIDNLETLYKSKKNRKE